MTYCFKCRACGSDFEVSRPMRDASLPATCTVCGELADRDWSVTPQIHVKDGTTHFSPRPCATWPVHSNAFRVPSPKQMKRQMEFNRLHGVSTEYDKDCRPVFTSAKHKARFLSARGAVDPSAGYSGAMGPSQAGPAPEKEPDDTELKMEAKRAVRARARSLGIKAGV